MARSIQELMTDDPRSVAAGDSVADAARAMRDGDVGVILVLENGKLSGIVTDRDVAIRAVAQGLDPNATPVSEIASETVFTLNLDQSVEDAVRLMREHDVRRVPVVQDDRPVGIVALGDLAVDLDTDSALADISAESPNR